jgi:ankyrin repeat protein
VIYQWCGFETTIFSVEAELTSVLLSNDSSSFRKSNAKETMADDEKGPDIGPPFMFAKYGEVLEFKALAEAENSPFDIETNDEQGFTVLLWASRNGHAKMVQYLLDKGANKESACMNGLRSLHHACNNNREACVRLLLKCGCDPNSADVMGNTPLHYAASRGILNLVINVVDEGGDIKALNKAGQSILHRATVGGHVGIVRFLIERGLDSNQQDKEGNTVNLRTVSFSHSNCQQLL